MDGILFLSIMIAFAWLVIWCFVDHSKPGRAWWPFDFLRRNAPDANLLPQQPTTKAKAAIGYLRAGQRSPSDLARKRTPA